MTNTEALNLVVGSKIIYRGEVYRVYGVRQIRDNSPEVEVAIVRNRGIPIRVLATHIEIM